MKMSRTKLGFEECWRRYVNGSDELEVKQLKRCLQSAVCFSEIVRVFNAASTSQQYIHLSHIRSQSLKDLISKSTNMSEAKLALALASKKRGSGGMLWYPARFKEAEEKLATFA